MIPVFAPGPFFDAAYDRIQNSPFSLKEYEDVLLSHFDLEWVATAPEDEVLEWAGKEQRELDDEMAAANREYERMTRSAFLSFRT